MELQQPPPPLQCVVIQPGKESPAPLPQKQQPVIRNNNNSVRASSRRSRVYVLRSFLLETFPFLSDNNKNSKIATTTNKQCTVLDVAGGKGDLSWLLHNADGIHSVVADPRLTKHEHLLRSVHFLLAHPDEAALRAIPGRPTHQPLAALIPQLIQRNQTKCHTTRKDCEGSPNEAGGTIEFRDPRHLRIFIDQRLVDAVKCVLESIDDNENNNGNPTETAWKEWREYWKNATNRAKRAEPLGYKERGDQTSGAIQDAKEALATIRSIRLVVGFHPDQAVDACIDLAQTLGVPFCVCPCCVFPKEFPHRRTPSGDPVKRYDDLLEYLESKDPHRIKKAYLNFTATATAKNVVLYTLPETTGDGGEDEQIGRKVEAQSLLSSSSAATAAAAALDET